jgi:hypothetical protein
MADSISKTLGMLYHGATPIMEEGCLTRFDEIIDRCVAGETFVLIRNGTPVIFMVPYDKSQALVERAKQAPQPES